ncbi:MAG TPA: hypothetical protein VIM07_06890 [Chitinophagaceae bacterium]
MQEIIKTILLEYDKSTFIIDIIKHSNEQLYIEVDQTIHLENDINQFQKIKINPSILDDIIETLTYFKENLPKSILTSKRYFSKERKDEIKKRYFKGISIKNLALQFDCTVNIIEQILTNSGIEIVSNDIPKRKRQKKY